MCLAVPGCLRSIESRDPGGTCGSELESLDREGVVDFGGVERRVSLAFVPEARVGDFVLVHAGVAIRTMTSERAWVTLRLLGEAEVARAESDSDRGLDDAGTARAGRDLSSPGPSRGEPWRSGWDAEEVPE